MYVCMPPKRRGRPPKAAKVVVKSEVHGSTPATTAGGDESALIVPPPTMEIETMQELSVAHEDQIKQLELTDQTYVEGEEGTFDEVAVSHTSKLKEILQDDEVASEDEYDRTKDKDEVVELLADSKLSLQQIYNQYGLERPPSFVPVTAPSSSGEKMQGPGNESSSSRNVPSTRAEQLVALETSKREITAMLKQMRATKAATKVPETISEIRVDVHWDFLMKEMCWMSDDFKHEKKWKRIKASKLAREALAVWRKKQGEIERLKKERAQTIMQNFKRASTQVKTFWKKIDKVVTFKHRSKIDETRRLAMDKHLSFMVKQTERYSALLSSASASLGTDQIDGPDSDGAENKAAAIETAMASTSLSKYLQDGTSADDMDDMGESDGEYLTGSEPDDLETLVKEEQDMLKDPTTDYLEDVKNEQIGLRDDASTAIEDILPPGYLTFRDTEVRKADNGLAVGEKRKREELEQKEHKVARPKVEVPSGVIPSLASAMGDGMDSAEDDDDYMNSDCSVDDETTLIEEEQGPNSKAEHLAELSMLKKESKMSVEELRAKYAGAPPLDSESDSSASDARKRDSDGSDDDYSDEGELDDESTLREDEERQGAASKADHLEELSALKKEAEMTVEDLRKMYADAPAASDSDMDDSSANIGMKESNQRSKSDVDKYSSDDSYTEGSDPSEDDEATLALEEEQASSSAAAAKQELLQLKREAMMTAEELRALYTKPSPASDVSGVDESAVSSSSDDGHGAAGVYDSADDDDYMHSDDSVDDETTLIDEEQSGNSKAEHLEELSLLKKENDMSVEELRARYAGVPPLDSDSEDVSMTSEEAAGEMPATNIETGGQGSVSPELVPTPYLMNPKYTMRDYQREGLHWLASMSSRRLNGILADEMGLGKTIQTISLLAHLASEHGIWGPHLVIVPTSVLLNWEIEFKKFAPSFKVMSYYGSVKQRKEKRTGWTKPNAFHVCITSYQLAVIDTAVFKRKKWHYLILDEAHYIKNFKSQRWQALLTLNTQRRLLLSGTPLQNNLMELWSLLHFLMPHIFQSQSEFQYWFNQPMTGMVEGSTGVNNSLVARLHGVIRPFLLRRLKADVESQMPKKYEHIVPVPLARRQQYLYEDFMSRSSTRQKLTAGGYMGQMGVLMALRKVCNHPDLFEPRAIVSPFALKPLMIRVPYLAQICDAVDVWERTSIFDVPLNLWSMPEEANGWFVRRFQALSVDAKEIARDGAGQLTWRSTPTDRFDTPTATTSAARAWLATNVAAQAALDATHRADRAASLARINETRCHGVLARMSVYSKSLRDAFIVKSPTNRVVEQSERPSEYLNYASLLRALVKTHFERTVLMKEVVHKFIVVIPPASAPPPSCETTRPFPWVQTKRKRNSKLIAEALEVSAAYQAGHVSRMMRRVLFPDKWLVQYDSGKLIVLDKMLHRLKSEGHRCLIFTQMTNMLNVLENFMCLHGHTYFRLDGATSVEKRQSLTERFNRDPKVFAFILSTRSGGLGINLVGADTVIFYDTDWNPAMDAQAQDRAHRIGQTRDVHIYRLVTQHTVEENIIKKANQKRELNMLSIENGNFTTEFFSGDTKNGPDSIDMVDLLSGTGVEVAGQGNDEGTDGTTSATMAKAMAAVEDEVDRDATQQAAQEQLNDAAEFDETKQLTVKSAGDNAANPTNVAAQKEKADDEVLEANLRKLWEGKDELGALKALEMALRPVDRYALSFRQDVEPIWNNVATEQWREQVLNDATERELEIEEIESARLKEEKLLETSTEMVRAAPTKRMSYGRYKKLFLNLREARENEVKKRRMDGGEWELHRDEKLKRDYYFNTRTGKCTWSKPEVLAVRDAQRATRAGGFKFFPPALLRLVFMLCDTQTRRLANVACWHWYCVGMHRSMWIRVIPNYKLRSMSSGGVMSRGNLGVSLKTSLWGDNWFTESGMGDSGIGLPFSHSSMRALYETSMQGRVFETFYEAFEHAQSGDTIAFEPGTYSLRTNDDGLLLVNKCIRLIAGDGDGDVFHGGGPPEGEAEDWDEPGGYKSISVDGKLKSPLVTFAMDNPRGTLQFENGHFVLVGIDISREQSVEGGAPPLMRMKRGSLKMYNCTVLKQQNQFVAAAEEGRASFIHIEGPSSLCFLAQCELTNAHGNAVVVENEGELIVSKCMIQENGESAIKCTGGAFAVVTSSKLNRNKGHGVYVEDPSSRVTVRDNEIKGNARGAVHVCEGNALVKQTKNTS